MESESKAIQVWEQELKLKAPSTRRIYTYRFKQFLERWSLDADQLFALRQTNLKSDDPRDKQEVERMVRVMMAESIEKGYSASTSAHYSRALTSFFEAQGLPLNIRAKDKPKGYSNGQRLALGEHIRVMWDNAGTEFKLRNRAALMFLKDSGFRIGDANRLNVSDWLESESRVVDGETFKVFDPRETEKTSAPAHSIIGPEAVNAVDAYLEERRENGLPRNPDTPLFLNRKNKRFHSDGFGHILQRLGKFVDKNGISAHSLRKFHTTMLESGGVPQNWIRKLQGKAISGSMGPYSLPEETGELFAAYVRAYPKLRIFGETASVQVVKEQENQIELLRAEVARLKSGGDNELSIIRKELDEMKQRWNNVEEFLGIARSMETMRQEEDPDARLSYPLRSVIQIIKVAKNLDASMSDEEMDDLLVKLKQAGKVKTEVE